MGFFTQAFFVFLMKESKKRRRKQLGQSQPVNLPGARPLMNPLVIKIIICYVSILCLTDSGTIYIHEEWLHISEPGREQN